MGRVVASHVFYWLFAKNMPEMIKCLVTECGYQFRWTRERHIEWIVRRIFDAADWEFYPKWRGDVDEDDLDYEKGDRRAKGRKRAASAYKVQMKMLDFLIQLGFPFELFFPVEPDIELEEGLFKEGKLDSQLACRDYVMSLSSAERKARDRLTQACSAYNWIQGSGETLTLAEFYNNLKSRWNGQQSPQIVRPPEIAGLDLLWRREENPPDGILAYPLHRSWRRETTLYGTIL